jgi:hypothetical protein
MKENEDVHFYIDNAPPKKVLPLLHVLNPDKGLTANEAAAIVTTIYGATAVQKDNTYAPRRLYDLGLAVRERRGARTEYRLSQLGAKIQSILAADEALALDVLHYLHFTGYIAAFGDQLAQGSTSPRKYLWSYRRCCELIWAEGHVIPPRRLAAILQAEMAEKFSHLDFNARIGARVDDVGVGRVLTWLRALSPAPFSGNKQAEIRPRSVRRPELVLLALDDLYRANGYRYGDAVLMDEKIIHQIAGVFFLDHACCRGLLHLAAQITSIVQVTNTFAGPSVKLLRPFRVTDL